MLLEHGIPLFVVNLKFGNVKITFLQFLLHSRLLIINAALHVTPSVIFGHKGLANCCSKPNQPRSHFQSVSLVVFMCASELSVILCRVVIEMSHPDRVQAPFCTRLMRQPHPDMTTAASLRREACPAMRTMTPRWVLGLS